jgi:hypothetical protein
MTDRARSSRKTGPPRIKIRYPLFSIRYSPFISQFSIRYSFIRYTTQTRPRSLFTLTGYTAAGKQIVKTHCGG